MIWCKVGFPSLNGNSYDCSKIFIWRSHWKFDTLCTTTHRKNKQVCHKIPISQSTKPFEFASQGWMACQLKINLWPTGHKRGSICILQAEAGVGGAVTRMYTITHSPPAATWLYHMKNIRRARGTKSTLDCGTCHPCKAYVVIAADAKCICSYSRLDIEWCLRRLLTLFCYQLLEIVGIKYQYAFDRCRRWKNMLR